MPIVTLCVTSLHRTAHQDRTRSVQSGMRRGASHDS
ncbi:hydrogenase expression protein [Pseudomonas amygdali pv. morsprunorum]|nr:hydrogenase expression protein [Pseudomonas amygdali pv. morsprunorum]POP95901.1 hydrogenase expression protein [Pseudomonas amygdali pv. morsprunorum]POY78976.1 hydrogenase expression protein [Pseudomonas amygdali pv. morsprunorum]